MYAIRSYYATIMSTIDDRYGVFEMPYLFKDRAQVKRVAEDPQVQKMLYDPLPAKGVRVLGFWENGFRVITNNVRPIVTPEDLKGIKLRTPKGVWRVKMFKAYGANPTPMAYGEVFAALQAGVIDGQENPRITSYNVCYTKLLRGCRCLSGRDRQGSLQGVPDAERRSKRRRGDPSSRVQGLSPRGHGPKAPREPQKSGLWKHGPDPDGGKPRHTQHRASDSYNFV